MTDHTQDYASTISTQPLSQRLRSICHEDPIAAEMLTAMENVPDPGRLVAELVGKLFVERKRLMAHVASMPIWHEVL